MLFYPVLSHRSRPTRPRPSALCSDLWKSSPAEYRRGQLAKLSISKAVLSQEYCMPAFQNDLCFLPSSKPSFHIALDLRKELSPETIPWKSTALCWASPGTASGSRREQSHQDQRKGVCDPAPQERNPDMQGLRKQFLLKQNFLFRWKQQLKPVAPV